MDEQLRWLGGLAQADLVRAQQANPAAPETEAGERTRRRGSGLNALTWEAAPDRSPDDAYAYGTALPPPTASAAVSGVSRRRRTNTVPLAHVKDLGGAVHYGAGCSGSGPAPAPMSTGSAPFERRARVGAGEDQAAPELLQSFSRWGAGFFAIINVWLPQPLRLLPLLRGQVSQHQDRRRHSRPGQPAAGGRAPPPSGRLQRPVICRSCPAKSR
jgi:hypothetical protein